MINEFQMNGINNNKMFLSVCLCHGYMKKKIGGQCTLGDGDNVVVNIFNKICYFVWRDIALSSSSSSPFKYSNIGSKYSRYRQVQCHLTERISNECTVWQKVKTKEKRKNRVG